MYKNISAPISLYGSSGIEVSQIEAFNVQFTSYAGRNLKAAHIRDLFATINASNAYYKVDSEEDECFVKYTGPKASTFSSNKQYKVELKYNDEGYVCEVIVTENGNIDKKDNVKRSK